MAGRGQGIPGRGQGTESIGRLLASREVRSGKYDIDQARREHIYLKGITQQANQKLLEGNLTFHEITEGERQQYPALYTIVNEIGDGKAIEEYNTLIFNARVMGVKKQPKFGRSLSSEPTYRDEGIDDSIKAVMDWARNKNKGNISQAEREVFTYRLAEENIRKHESTSGSDLAEIKKKISKEFEGMEFPCVLGDFIKEAASELSKDVIAKAKEQVTMMHLRQQISMKLVSQEQVPDPQEQNILRKGVRSPTRSEGEPSKSKEEKAREEEQMRKSLFIAEPKDLQGQGKDGKVLVPKEELDRLVNAEKMYRAQIDELTLRLSSFASKQLIDGNPNISDLSDANRPTKIGEKFSELYDNEWTDAFEEFTNLKVKDGDVLDTLIEIVKLTFDFTKETADHQSSRLQHKMCECITHMYYQDMTVRDPKYDPKHLASVNKYSKDFRKAAGLASVPSLCVLFKECCLKSRISLDSRIQPALNEFIDKCVEYTWLMNIQDPPMCLMYANKGEKINTNQFSAYKHKGTTVKQNVWPAVLLHRNGPLVKKGYVLPVK